MKNVLEEMNIYPLWLKKGLSVKLYNYFDVSDWSRNNETVKRYTSRRKTYANALHGKQTNSWIQQNIRHI